MAHRNPRAGMAAAALALALFALTVYWASGSGGRAPVRTRRRRARFEPSLALPRAFCELVIVPPRPDRSAFARLARLGAAPARSRPIARRVSLCDSGPRLAPGQVLRVRPFRVDPWAASPD